jgi:hypothetical protein
MNEQRQPQSIVALERDTMMCNTCGAVLVPRGGVIRDPEVTPFMAEVQFHLNPNQRTTVRQCAECLEVLRNLIDAFLRAQVGMPRALDEAPPRGWR